MLPARDTDTYDMYDFVLMKLHSSQIKHIFIIHNLELAPRLLYLLKD